MNKNEAQTGSLTDSHAGPDARPHVRPLGERGLLFTFAPQEEQALPLPVPLPVQQRVWALSAWLGEHREKFRLREIVPGMANLLLVRSEARRVGKASRPGSPRSRQRNGRSHSP